MKKISFVGRVVEIYRELPWSAYGRSAPEGHPADEKPTRISLEVNGSLELAAVLPPEVGGDFEVGSAVKIVLAPAAESELAEAAG